MSKLQTLKVEVLKDGHILVNDYAIRFLVHRIRKSVHDSKHSVVVLMSNLDEPTAPMEEVALPLGFVVSVVLT